MRRQKSIEDINNQANRLIRNAGSNQRLINRILETASRYNSNIRNTKSYKNAFNKAMNASASTNVIMSNLKPAREKKYSQRTYMGATQG